MSDAFGGWVFVEYERPDCRHPQCRRVALPPAAYCCEACCVSHRTGVPPAHTEACELAERAKVRAAIEQVTKPPEP